MILLAEVSFIMPVNSYFFIDDETKHGFLIDPGAEADKLLEIVQEKNWTIEKILLTHGHFDHIGAANEIQETLQIPVCMHENGVDYAYNPEWNLSANFGFDLKLNEVSFFKDGDEIFLKSNPDFKVKLIHSPGHTTDGATFYSEKIGVAFVGDTIFKMSRGRTDFPGGDEKILLDTIKNKILTLPDEIFLLNGHDVATTVKDEKKYYF